MRSGKLSRRFYAKGKHEAILRTPTREDLDDFLELINSPAEERAEILSNELVPIDEGIDFLAGLLSRLENNELFFLVAEVDGKVVASSGINRRTGYEKHEGVIGLAIKTGFMDLV
jgi:hypothetical protein